MDFQSLHVQSVACPRMRTLVLQTMDFQSIVVDCSKKEFLKKTVSALGSIRDMGYRSLSRTLRESIRYAARARRILRDQGFGALRQSMRRRLGAIPAIPGHKPRLLALSSPFHPLDLPGSQRPLASVVIPMTDDPKFAHHCLVTLGTHRSVHPYEVIVVDCRPAADAAIPLPCWNTVRILTKRACSGVAAALNHGAAVANGKYLVLLDSHLQVQDQWLDALLETFALKPDAGIVGSRLLYPDGRQREAGGRGLEDSGICSYGHLEDPCRPEFNYLRPTDYCSAASFAMRRSLFAELKGFDEGLSASDDLAVDLALRVSEADYGVYYQPHSEAVQFDSDRLAHDENGCRLGPDTGSRERFLRRWEAGLRARTAQTDSQTLGSESQRYKRAFVADFAIPTPDRDSGSLRMVHLLAILQELGFGITFASMGLEVWQPYLADLQKRGIECLYRPYVTSGAEHLREQGGRYDLVILSRLDTAAELLPIALRWCPRAKIVSDTVDLHFQRLAREAAVEGNPRIERIANRRKKQELGLIAQAHTTLVVSEVEQELLAGELPQADVHVVSNIHRIRGSARSFEARRDILFVGGGVAHPPNMDAVLFFARAVFPRVLEQIPDIRFLVVGSDPLPEIVELADVSLHILGYVPELDELFNTCRLSVAPLRFGAGVKGKVNQSLAYGLPVVATTIAAEGMFLQDGQSVLIANDC